MGLLRDILGSVTIVAVVVAIPLVCHLCIRSLWKAVGCGLLYYVIIWPAEVPAMATVGVALASLSLVLALSRWRAATGWLILAALLGWCMSVAATSDDRWALLLLLPALAPLPTMVGVFVAAFRQQWTTVKWGRAASLALALYSIWWWVELFPTTIGWDARLAAMPIGMDSVVLVGAAISFFRFEQSPREWGAFGAGTLVILVLVALWVARSTEGSHTSPQAKCGRNVYMVLLYLSEHAGAHEGALPESLGTLSREYGEDLDPRLLVCPVAERRGIPPSEDGYEYAGAGLRVSEIKDLREVPIVFDRAGNHRNHTRSVGFVGWSVSELTERQFRGLLLRAVRASAYPNSTVEELKAKEPWLATEMTRAR